MTLSSLITPSILAVTWLASVVRTACGFARFEGVANIPAGHIRANSATPRSGANRSTAGWGSAAMDRVGNLALGYSVSSQNLIANGDDNNGFPSIRYTGRFADDPLGQLRPGEVTAVQGSGVQENLGPSSDRWGDYSAMAVDPVDDCTFWYTQEYIPANGFWQTRIASFRFPDCKKKRHIDDDEDPGRPGRI